MQDRERLMLHLGWHHSLAASGVISIAPSRVPNRWEMAGFLFKRVSSEPLNLFHLGMKGGSGYLWATTGLLSSTSLHHQAWACHKVSYAPFASDCCWALMALMIGSSLRLYVWFWSSVGLENASFWTLSVRSSSSCNIYSGGVSDNWRSQSGYFFHLPPTSPWLPAHQTSFPFVLFAIPSWLNKAGLNLRRRSWIETACRICIA